MLRLVTDSAANVPQALVDEEGIEVVPLKVQIGTKSYLEGQDLSPSDFYRQLPTANPMPTTSQPAPMDFQAVYERLLAQGDEILSIHLSNALSGTFNSARTAAMTLESQPISVVDSMTVSAGCALLVLAAARLRAAGQGRTAIAAELERLVGENLMVFTLDTLEYLKRGGRIGGAAALIGGLFNIKPLIMVKDGKVEAAGRARSRKKALEQMIAMQHERFGSQPLWIGMAEAEAPDIAELEALARERLNVQALIRCQIGPVVGTHTGPNVAGIAAMAVPRGL